MRDRRNNRLGVSREREGGRQRAPVAFGLGGRMMISLTKSGRHREGTKWRWNLPNCVVHTETC